MSKINLIGKTELELIELMQSLNQAAFKGKQLFKWIYHNRRYDFSAMTDLSIDIRQKLEAGFELETITAEKIQISEDGTRKFLFRLHDDNPIEAVLIPDENKRNTLCVSSQAGCALGCTFCATGTMGLLRNLTVGEIVGQLMYVRDELGDDAFSNVVFMGMGEPLDNYQIVVEALEIMFSATGLNISPKKVTVSTSGITPKIKKLAESGLKPRLAISLHAATQEKRLKIMPVARTFKLDKLIGAVKYYREITGTRVTFEYILFEGFNDRKEDVRALSKLLGRISCQVNLLAYNPVESLDFKRPDEDNINIFASALVKNKLTVTVRKSRGLDIDAACGQLAAKELIRN